MNQNKNLNEKIEKWEYIWSSYCIKPVSMKWMTFYLREKISSEIFFNIFIFLIWKNHLAKHNNKLTDKFWRKKV